MEHELSQLPPYGFVDFNVLASKDPSFDAVWQKSKPDLDFQDPKTCQILTRSLLHIDFGLELDLPDDRLCPPIPNRWNYVSWIQGLLDSTAPDYSSGYDPNREVIGLDIGTGASAIYPLLALKSRPKWTICVTDIDKKSFEWAARNLALNKLMTRAKMLLQLPDADLLPLKSLGADKLDFTICNPPFFASKTEVQTSLKGQGKSQKPNAICTGSENEMVYPGGDLAFVKRIIDESLELRERVTWYSSMLGKLSSAKMIVDTLRQNGIHNFAIGCLEPGYSTKRWVVAWSFGDLRPRIDIARHPSIGYDHLPFPTRYAIHLPNESDMTAVEQFIHTQLSSLDLRWTWNPDLKVGVGEASQNVWNRAFRRARERLHRMGNTSQGPEKEPQGTALAFRISLVQNSEKQIIINWLRGTDVQLWESFCGFVHRDFKKS